MKDAWIIVDLSTGSIDGLYHDYAFAKGAFERFVRRGAKNLALCEVEEMAGRGKLEDGAFWRTNGRGFDRAGPSDADGWVEWSGGERPVAGSVLVDIRCRDKSESLEAEAADLFRWDHRQHRGDIIAYRPHP